MADFQGPQKVYMIYENQFFTLQILTFKEAAIVCLGLSD